MDVENLRDTLMTSISAYAQAIPEMAAQGQDASAPVRAIATLINERKKGTPVEKAAEMIFPEPAPEPEPAAPAMPGMPGEMPPGMAPPGGAPSFDTPPPAGMQQLLSQLSGTGQPSTSIRTVSQRPVA